MERDGNIEDKPFLPSSTSPSSTSKSHTTTSPREATIFSTVLNLSNNIVGAGILSLPHCFLDASIIPGSLLLLSVGILSALSVLIVAITCQRTGYFSFKELAVNIVGRKFGLLLQVTMFVYTFLSCVSFLILMGDFFSGESGVIMGLVHLVGVDEKSKVVEFLSKRFNIVMILTVLILFPLSSMRNLNALRHTSMISVFGMLYLMFFLAYKYFTMHDHSNSGYNATTFVADRALTEGQNFGLIDGKHTQVEISYFKLSWNFFSAAPIINVAFNCHYNAPKYFQELRDRRITTFSVAVALAFSLCGIVYFFVAIFGYLTFGKQTHGDILTNFDNEDKLAIIARFCLTLVVMFTYPLAFNALRLAFIALAEKARGGDDISTPGNSNSKITGIIRIFEDFRIATILLIILTFIPGSLLNDIAVVLDYKGSILGGCIGFAFPAIMYLRYLSKKTKFLLNETNETVEVSEYSGQSEDFDLDESDDEQIYQDSEHQIATYHEAERKWRNPNRRHFSWKVLSVFFLIWAVFAGVLGFTITTIKVIKKE